MTYFDWNGEAAAIAETLISEYHPRLVGLHIAHLSKTKTSVRTKRVRDGRKITMAKTAKISDKMRALMTTQWQFVVEYDDNIWRELTGNQRRALVDHELMHIGNDADGAYLIPHQMEEFAEVLQRHGPWLEDRQLFLEAVDKKFHEVAQ